MRARRLFSVLGLVWLSCQPGLDGDLGDDGTLDRAKLGKGEICEDGECAQGLRCRPSFAPDETTGDAIHVCWDAVAMGDTCSEDFDCVYPLACAGNVCAPHACATTPECSDMPGTVCRGLSVMQADARCYPPAALGDECRARDNCEPGLICRVPADADTSRLIPECSACESDDDCDGAACQSGRCVGGLYADCSVVACQDEFECLPDPVRGGMSCSAPTGTSGAWCSGADSECTVAGEVCRPNEQLPSGLNLKTDADPRPQICATPNRYCSETSDCGSGYECNATSGTCYTPARRTWSCGGGGCCFVAGTMVDTPTGPKAIDALEAGDQVWSYNEATGQVEIGTVTTTFHHPDGPNGTVLFSDGTKIGSTPNHPFFHLASPSQLVPALFSGPPKLKINAVENLGSQDVLLRRHDQRLAPVTIESMSFDAEPAPTFNLTVEPHHNYFAEGVLVHNKG